MLFTLREVFTSIILEANPTISKTDLDRIVHKYAAFLRLRLEA